MKILNLHRECMDPSVEVEKASVDEGEKANITISQLQRFPNHEAYSLL